MGLSAFLMGLSDIPGYTDHNIRSHANNESVLPESFLRKDDVFYEYVKQLVEKGFGAGGSDIGQHIIHHDMEFSDLHDISRIVLTLLNDMSNNALYHMAKIVASDSISVDKTRPRLKKIIKEGLLDIRSCKDQSNQVKIQGEIRQLLKNPNNFCQNHVNHLQLTWKSHCNAIKNIHNGLEDMPSKTLDAMYRKFRGIRGYMPQLGPSRSGWTRDRLIDRVRSLCMGMIHQLGESDKLPEPLAKAMAVACLSSRLGRHPQDFAVSNFVHVPPELEALHNEIIKAISSLSQRTRKEEIKILKQLLDPESEVDGKGLKTAIINMLIEFLFECMDMDAIPDSLLHAVSFINKTRCNPRKFFSKDIIEEEVECILNVGACLKQILWDHVPDGMLDQDFADAYMEELEESDDGDIFDDGDDEIHLCTDALYNFHRFNDFTEEVQSNGDPELPSLEPQGGSEDTDKSSNSFSGATVSSDDFECPNSEINGDETLVSVSPESVSSPLGSPVSCDSGNNMRRHDLKDVSVDSMILTAENYSTVSHSKKIRVPESQSTVINQYVILQEVCDQASVIAYQLIGHVLNGFGQMESSNMDWDDESYLCGEHSTPELLQDPIANSANKDGGAIIVQAVHKVIPSFSNSELDTVKKLVNL